ncbi:MAG: aminopeptidase P family N-terminal domain-containing protein, partial [Desulfobacterales bacterium]|nr:aminopeptidase P family N-terminal domain-containing protein [Desulfobacterales bacterium]
MAASEKEIGRRCDAIRAKMEEEGLKALIVFSQVQTGYAGAVRYISNYHLTTRKEYLVFPLSGDPVLIVLTLGQQYYAKANSWIRDVRSSGEEGAALEAAKVLKTLKLENEAIGVVGLKTTIPYNDYRLLTEALPHARLEDATELMQEIRMVKGAEEIEMIQQVAEMADQCYERLLEVLRPGKDELQVMSEINKGLTALGVEDILILTAKGPSFPGFINHPGPYTFRKGDHYIFSVEISGPGGYWTQIARPVCLGSTTPQYERMFEVAMAALDAGLSNLTPGTKIGDLVQAVTEKGWELPPGPCDFYLLFGIPKQLSRVAVGSRRAVVTSNCVG